MTTRTDIPTALSHTIYRYDGGKFRSSPDEKNLFGAAKGFSFSTDEHGFGPGELILPRPDQWDPLDGAALAHMVTTDRNGRNVYESRISAMPHTGVNEVTIQTEGWSKHADDDESAKMIFINRNLNNWQGFTAARRNQLYGGGTGSVVDGEVSPDPVSGTPEIQCSLEAAYATSGRTGMMFDAGPGARIAQLFVLWAPVANMGSADATWTAFARLADTDQMVSPDPAGGTSPVGVLGGATANATTNNRRWACIEFSYGAANTTVHQEGRFFSVRVVGNHGLTLRGAHPSAGLFISDMIPYIVGRWCPRWNVRPDSIEQTSFIMQHADYREPQTTAGKMLDALVPYGGNANLPLDWFVYDNRTLYARSNGNYGNIYRFRKQEGADESDQGPDVSLMMNGAIVTYNPGDGTTLYVGPPGSGCDLETSQLLWTDPNHPANRAGINQWKTVDAAILEQNGAILLGQLAMAQRNNQQWRGSIDVGGPAVRDSNGNYHPPYMIRALEQCIMAEDPDLRQRRIVGTKYDDGKRQTQVDIGSPPDRIDTVLAKAGVLISDLGVS